MMKFDGLTAFVAVAEAGSVSAAARRLGIAKSVVSERLSELERALAARLVQRSTRKLSLTPDGAAFLVRARTILREAEEATAEMSERRGSLEGSLRLAGPISFGTLHLGPALYGFLAAHPAIRIDLDLDDRFVDAGADGYDAVIRHGPVHDTRLVVKHLASSRRVLVAAPTYLARRGAPRNLSELEKSFGDSLQQSRNGLALSLRRQGLFRTPSSLPQGQQRHVNAGCCRRRPRNSSPPDILRVSASCRGDAFPGGCRDGGGRRNAAPWLYRQSEPVREDSGVDGMAASGVRHAAILGSAIQQRACCPVAHSQLTARRFRALPNCRSHLYCSRYRSMWHRTS